MILVSHNINLSPTRPTDAPTLVDHMRDKEIWENTIAIPFPYSLQDAEDWLEDEQIFFEENGVCKDLAIRNETGKLIGSIGLHYNYGTDADKSEFGYWLAKPYWNKGIMTDVIAKYCEVAKTQYRLKQLEAHIFATNPASQKVLLKTGFLEKKMLPAYYKKDGRKIDAVKFVKQL